MKHSRSTKNLHVQYKNLQRVAILEEAFANDLLLTTEREDYLKKPSELRKLWAKSKQKSW